MCPVYSSVTHFSIKKNEISKFKLALFRKAKFFFYSNTNQNLPNFTINLFLFKQCSKNNCFQFSFYLLSYVFYSGMVLKTVLEEIQNKMK